MKKINKFFATLVLITMMGSTASSANAAEYCTEIAGCGYEDCKSAPCLTPAIALGAIALVAIIAVAIQNSDKGHCHGHDHCD